MKLNTELKDTLLLIHRLFEKFSHAKDVGESTADIAVGVPPTALTAFALDVYQAAITDLEQKGIVKTPQQLRELSGEAILTHIQQMDELGPDHLLSEPGMQGWEGLVRNLHSITMDATRAIESHDDEARDAVRIRLRQFKKDADAKLGKNKSVWLGRTYTATLMSFAEQTSSPLEVTADMIIQRMKLVDNTSMADLMQMDELPLHVH